MQVWFKVRKRIESLKQNSAWRLGEIERSQCYWTRAEIVGAESVGTGIHRW